MRSRIVVPSLVLFAALACSVAFADNVQTPLPVNGTEDGPRLGPTPASLNEPSNQKELRSKFGLLQVPFIKNETQIEDSRVKYFARTFTGGVFVEDDRITYAITSTKDGERKTWAVKESFVGAKSTKAQGTVASKTRVNFFKGNEAAKWKTNLPTYEVVGLGEVYDNVELNLKAYNSNMEKVFVVRQGGNPASIAARLDGVKRLSVDETGALALETKLGTLKMTPPVAYQEIDGRRSNVEVAYRLIDKNTYGFKVAAYNKSQPLVIDPLLGSTYLGDTGVDYGCAIAVDTSGAIYVTGYTNSFNFPVTNSAYAVDKDGYYDVFVSQLADDLTTLDASTFIGGNSDEYGYAIAIDTAGNIYVTGTTKSVDFPITSTAYAKRLSGSTDIFISKFDSTLSTLLSSTYFGGSLSDQVNTILLTNPGNAVYIAGATMSKDFPVTLASGFDVYYSGSGDGFISLLDTNLTTLTASTYLGGSSSDQINALAMESTGSLYAVGSTKSPDFPTTAYALSRTYNGGKADAFVTRIKGNLTDIEASTFLGGSDDEAVNAVVVGSTDLVYVTGYTLSSNFPITKTTAYDKSHNGKEDGFVTKLSWDSVSTPPRLKLDASTFIGGTSSDVFRAIALDSSGNVFVAGSTTSKDYPVLTTSYQVYKKLEDAVISKFTATLTTLPGTTFVGGSSNERIHGLVVDSSGKIYVVGATKSADFPVSTTAFQKKLGSTAKDDAFISVFSSLDK